jgi:hypothetical protein
MNTKQFLVRATEDKVIDQKTRDALLAYQDSMMETSARLTPGHIGMYGGVLTFMAAILTFFGMNIDTYGWGGVLTAVVIFGAVGLFFAEKGRKLGSTISAGLSSAISVIAVPVVIGILIIMSYEASGEMFGVFGSGEIKLLTSSAVVAGLLALWRYRAPFLLSIVALGIWFFMIEATFEIVTGPTSMVVGIAMLLVALVWDIRNQTLEKDFPFWLYFVGSLALAASLTEHGVALIFLLGMLFMFAGSVLARKTLAAFGGIGVVYGIGYALMEVIDTDGGLIVMAIVALIIAGLGFLWVNNHNAIASYLRSFLPESIQTALAKRM